MKKAAFIFPALLIVAGAFAGAINTKTVTIEDVTVNPAFPPADTVSVPFAGTIEQIFVAKTGSAGDITVRITDETSGALIFGASSFDTNLTLYPVVQQTDTTGAVVSNHYVSPRVSGLLVAAGSANNQDIDLTVTVVYREE